MGLAPWLAEPQKLCSRASWTAAGVSGRSWMSREGQHGGIAGAGKLKSYSQKVWWVGRGRGVVDCLPAGWMLGQISFWPADLT